MPKNDDVRIGSDGSTSFTRSDSDVAIPGASGMDLSSDKKITIVQQVLGDNIGNGHGVYAGSNGSERVTIEFRSIVAGEGIALTGDAETITITSTGVATPNLGDMSGRLRVDQGGTGKASLESNGILIGNGTDPVKVIPAPTSADQFLTWNGYEFVWVATPDVVLPDNGVLAGEYSYPTLKVDSKGRVSEISSNTLPKYEGANLGTSGPAVYSGMVGNTLNFKRIIGTDGISVTTDIESVIVGIQSVGYSRGGTGQTAFTSNSLVYATPTKLESTPAPTNPNVVLKWNGTGYEWVNLEGPVDVLGDSYIKVTPEQQPNGNKRFQLEFNANNLGLNNIGGTLSVSKGGTGATTFTHGGLVVGNGTGALTTLPSPSTNNALLRWDGSKAFWDTSTGMVTSITAGQGLSTTANSTNGGGSITSTGMLHLTNTGVVAGKYNVFGGIVDSKGRLLEVEDKQDFLLDRQNHTGIMPIDKLEQAGPGVFDFGIDSKTKTRFVEVSKSIKLVEEENEHTLSLSLEEDKVIDKTTNLEIEFSNQLTFVSGVNQIGWAIDAAGKLVPHGAKSNIGTEINRIGTVYATAINSPDLSPISHSGDLSDAVGILSIDKGGTGIDEIGEAGQFLAVNDDGTGLEFVSSDSIIESIPVASEDTAGVVKVGTGLKIDQDGRLYTEGGGSSSGGLTRVKFKVFYETALDSVDEARTNENLPAGWSMVVKPEGNRTTCTFYHPMNDWPSFMSYWGVDREYNVFVQRVAPTPYRPEAPVEDPGVASEDFQVSLTEFTVNVSKTNTGARGGLDPFDDVFFIMDVIF